jgi:hypothetical protein
MPSRPPGIGVAGACRAAELSSGRTTVAWSDLLKVTPTQRVVGLVVVTVVEPISKLVLVVFE